MEVSGCFDRDLHSAQLYKLYAHNLRERTRWGAQKFELQKVDGILESSRWMSCVSVRLHNRFPFELARLLTVPPLSRDPHDKVLCRERVARPRSSPNAIRNIAGVGEIFLLRRKFRGLWVITRANCFLVSTLSTRRFIACFSSLLLGSPLCFHSFSSSSTLVQIQ